MTQRDIFKATVTHRATGAFLFNASFTPDLAPRVYKEYGVADFEAFLEARGVVAAFEA